MAEGVWRTIGGRRVFIEDGQSLEEAMQKSGKFATITSDVEIRKKINSVNIDFDSDNTLPGLNKEDLIALGKEDKPVLLKKVIIDRNLLFHPDVQRSEYNFLIGQALYNYPTFFPGHKDDYMNLVCKIDDKYNSLVLVQMSESKDNYEIIHFFRINDKKLDKMKR